MDSSLEHPQQQFHQHNSGLLRYRSAPSSLLASLIGNNNNNNNNHGCVDEEVFTSEDHHHHQSYLPSTSSEMETMLSKLVSSNHRWSNSEPFQEFGDKPVKQETGDSVQQNGYSYGGSRLIYNSQQIQGFENGLFMASENSTQSKMSVSNSSNIIRQKSSPAGFFSNGNGLAVTSGLNGTENFSSRLSFCLTRMPQIAENRNESLETNCDQSNLVNYNGNSKSYMPSFTSDIWDNSAFSAQKTESEDEIVFSTSNGLESQEAEFCYQNLGLTHHLSLPSPSTKMESMKKFLQIQGSVPCKIRAKRGFATHPRSIAERVRRTRISERIKKLEGLFPKSDKQTSTADMLDSAVEYIKDLQEQVKILSDCREKCKCTSNEKQYSRCCA